MKAIRWLVCVAALALCQPCFSVKTVFVGKGDWMAPEVSQRNRQPIRPSYHTDSPSLSLDGLWKFALANDPDSRPLDFFVPSFKDAFWREIAVPGAWELQGLIAPECRNGGVPWNEMKAQPPYIPVTGNFVGQYRRHFTLGPMWKGRTVLLHVGSASSNVSVWVNGKEAGYSEDSRLDACFDITSLVRQGDNVIALEVFRWCDGTYLEDQDYWRMSGLFRSVWLEARPKRRIEDLKVVAGADGKLSISSTLSKGSQNVEYRISRNGNVVLKLRSSSGVASGVVRNPELWSAEMPNLYSLEAFLPGSDETVRMDFGFRDLSVSDGQLVVNGSRVRMRIVSRAEFGENGPVVSEEEMLRDIRLMKSLNINAVRTGGYPCDPLWYELCDRYGLYVIDDANIGRDGLSYCPNSLSFNPRFRESYLDRVSRVVARDVNHPCIVVWGLGSEPGVGVTFDKCCDLVKSIDPTRPLLHELSYIPQVTLNFADQTIKESGSDGLTRFRYTDDGSSLSTGWEGVVSLDRRPHFQAFELAQRYRPIASFATPDEAGFGLFHIYNGNSFTSLDKYGLHWELIADGKRVLEGNENNLDAEPLRTTTVDLHFNAYELSSVKQDIHLNLEYFLKEDDGFLPASTVVSRDQILINETVPTFIFKGGRTYVESRGDDLVFSGKTRERLPWEISFNDRTGFLSSYIVNGIQYVSQPLTPCFGRALTAGDVRFADVNSAGEWLYPEITLKSFRLYPGCKLRVVHVLKGLGEVEMIYYINADATVEVEEHLTGLVSSSPLFRVGMEFAMPGRFGRVEYYGNGPYANYVDRQDAAMVGRWSQSVREQYDFSFPRPQEGGSRSGLRSFEVCDGAGAGLEFLSKDHFSASALPFSRRAQDVAAGGASQSCELERLADAADAETYVNVDLRQMGVEYGSDGSIPGPVTIPAKDYTFKFVLRPHYQ